MNYTAEDELLIQEKYDDLMSICEKICKSDSDRDFIKKAFFLAKEAHKGVRRRSGEPYLLHPIAVAKIAVEEIGLGVKSVVAALLHDVVEDTEYTVEDITNILTYGIPATQYTETAADKTPAPNANHNLRLSSFCM